MTQRILQSLSDSIRRQASREYIRERVTMTRREVKNESENEIRAAVRGLMTTNATD